MTVPVGTLCWPRPRLQQYEELRGAFLSGCALTNAAALRTVDARPHRQLHRDSVSCFVPGKCRTRMPAMTGQIRNGFDVVLLNWSAYSIWYGMARFVTYMAMFRGYSKLRHNIEPPSQNGE